MSPLVDRGAEALTRRLLFACVQFDALDVAAFTADARRVTDWGTLFRRAEILGALPPLLWALGRTGALQTLPAAQAQAATDAQQQHAVHATLLLRDASIISAALTRAGVAHVFLKGTALLARHYPSPSARHIDDIDLLVGEADLPLTLRTFESLRITPRPTPQSVMEALHPGRYREQQHDTPAGTNIDLHWQVGGDDELHMLLSRAEHVPVPSASAQQDLVLLPVPHPLDLFTQLCSHVIVHHGAHQKYLLRHIADLRVLTSTSTIPAVQIKRWLAHPRTSVAVSMSLALLSGSAGGKLARAAELMVFPPPSVARLRDHATHLERLVERTMIASRSPRTLLGHLFPPRDYVAQRFGVSPTSPLLPGLYAARLLQLPFVPLPR